MESVNLNNLRSENRGKIIIYGTGVLGEIAYYGLKKWGFQPDFYCDHDPDETEFMGVTVISPMSLYEHREDTIVIAFKDFFARALSNLEEAGCENIYHMKDLIALDYSKDSLSHRAREILSGKINYDAILQSAMEKNQIRMAHCEIFVTEKCSLSCRDCSAMIPYFKNPHNMDVTVFGEAIERLLETVDYIGEVSVLGGEPLLHPKLPPFILPFIDSPKVGKIGVYTNGTVLPGEELTEILKKPKIWVHISDYNNEKQKLSAIEEIFQKEGIRYFIRQYESWIAAGDLTKRLHSEEELKDMFARCIKARCYSFYEGRLYACVRASNGHALGAIEEVEYVDFNTEGDTETKREQLKKLLELPYTKACCHCDGMMMTGRQVPPAVQQKKETGM